MSIGKEFVINKGELVKYCGDGGYVIIPDEVRKIGNLVFENCDAVTEVVIPASVESVGKCAFR